MLAPQVHLTGAALAATIGFHYISPWATIAAWLLFGPRPRISWSTVAGAFVWPLAWLGYIFTQGAFTDWYPYPFLDVTELSLGAAIRNAGLVVVLALALRHCSNSPTPGCRPSYETRQPPTTGCRPRRSDRRRRPGQTLKRNST